MLSTTVEVFVVMLSIITQKTRSPAPWNYNPRLSEPGLCFYSQPSRNCNPGTLLNTLTLQRYKPFAQYPTIGRMPIVLARVLGTLIISDHSRSSQGRSGCSISGAVMSGHASGKIFPTKGSTGSQAFTIMANLCLVSFRGKMFFLAITGF